MERSSASRAQAALEAPASKRDDRRTPLCPGSFRVSVDHAANAIYVSFFYGHSVEQLVRYAVVVRFQRWIVTMRVRMEGEEE
jgi:hypothetical protein